MNRLGAAIRIPDVPVQSDELRSFASQLGRIIWRFNLAVNRALIAYREPILDMQLVQERIADAARSSLPQVASSVDGTPKCKHPAATDPRHRTRAAELFLRQSFRRARRLLGNLNDNEDRAVLGTANSVLSHAGNDD